MSVTFVLILCIIFLSGCGNELYSEGEGEIEVVCTSFPLFDMAREVGGGRIKVTILQDSGSDTHNYTPTSATLEALSRADLLIYVGGDSDAWVADAVKASQNERIVLLPLIDHIEPIHAELECDWSDGHEHEHEHEHKHEYEHEHEHGDEHIWASLVNAKVMVKEICDAFSVTDPQNAEFYKSNASNYQNRLDVLENEYRELFESRNFAKAVFADRFPFVYLLRDYKVPYVAAFSGCSSETNSSFSMQIGLIEAVKDGGSSCVFVIEGGDKTLAEAVSRDTGCRILSLNSMQSIRREDIENGARYIDIMEENLKVLREAAE